MVHHARSCGSLRVLVVDKKSHLRAVQAIFTLVPSFSSFIVSGFLMLVKLCPVL